MHASISGRTLLIGTVVAGIGSAPFMASTAAAHIHLTYPLSRTDSQFSDQKDAPCGVSGGTRDPSRVTTLAPGATITVTWEETIQHPGHFRIAFDPDGQDFVRPPTMNGSTEGTDPLVLRDLIPDGTLSQVVTLPNLECDNCTLQFIQVMYDKLPYTVDDNSNDVYFNCADLQLTNNPPDPPGPGTPDPNPPGAAMDGGCQSSAPTWPSTLICALVAGWWGMRRSGRLGVRLHSGRGLDERR